jgi:hypothetical protein
MKIGEKEMPKFTVSIARTTTEAADITIEAEDDDAAQSKVMELINDPDLLPQLGFIDWTLEEEEFDCLDVNEAS